MSRDLVFVLRGRPGLGHVIPGLAIAHEMRARGWRPRLLSYGNGSAFLRASGEPDWAELRVPGRYLDWPGLELYDHGVGAVLPRVEEIRPAAVVLGGEYLLAPLAAAVHAPVGMIFNAEIFEDTPRNRSTSRLFARLFDSCAFLIPLHPLEGRYVPELERLRDRLLPAGSFGMRDRNAPRGAPVTDGRSGEAGGIQILVANGGGVSFPARTASYSSGRVPAGRWLRQTREMTRAAVEAALEVAGAHDQVVVFSCLGEEWNAHLAACVSGRNLLVRSPSLEYYRYLAEAAVVVSRAGAGFLADADATEAQVVVWPLREHDEQAVNAAVLGAARPGTYVVRSVRALRAAVLAAVTRARGGASPRAGTGIAAERTRQVADALEAGLAGRTPPGELRSPAKLRQVSAT